MIEKIFSSYVYMLKLFALHIICRPAGWDNMKKISILHENLQSMKANDYYRDVIAQPATNRKVCNRTASYYCFALLIHTTFLI